MLITYLDIIDQSCKVQALRIGIIVAEGSSRNVGISPNVVVATQNANDLSQNRKAKSNSLHRFHALCSCTFANLLGPGWIG